MGSVKQWLKKNFPDLIYRKQRSEKTRNALLKFEASLPAPAPGKLSDASFDVFTYHGEDGMIFYLLNQLKGTPSFFLDIGAGDCIRSNCATLAWHFNWEGVFIDREETQLSVGKEFYRTKIKDGRHLQFIQKEVTPENINTVIGAHSGGRQAGLLSIDIDGNDFWIWNAISGIKPRLVIIEAKVEFGLKNIVVPYGIGNHRSVNEMYNGASVNACIRLGKEKGYKLVGANKQGYNLFFVPQEEDIPVVSAEQVLNEKETFLSFYPESFFRDHEFVTFQ